MKNWKVILTVILVFLLGFVGGALTVRKVCENRIERFLSGGPKVVSQIIVKRLSRRLHLNDVQRDQLRTAVDKAGADIAAIRKQFAPQIEAIVERSQDEIRTTLTPEQREKFDKLIAERKARWGR